MFEGSKIILVVIAVVLGLANLVAAEFDDPNYWAAYDPGANGIGTDPDGYIGAVFDGQYVYFAPGHNGSDYHGEVLRYDTNDVFTDPCSWSTYDPGANGVGSDPDGFLGAVFDGRYVYFVPSHNGTEHHGEVLRYDTNELFTDPCSWATYDPGANGVGTDPDGYYGAVFDGRHVYFVPNYDGSQHHGEVLRYDTNDVFTDPCSWSTYDPGANGVGSDPDGFIGAVFNGRYVYFVPSYNGTEHTGEVLRYDTNEPFTDPCSWSTYDPGANGVGTEPDGFAGAVFDGKYIHFAPIRNGSGYHGEVLRYDTNDVFTDPYSWAAYDPGANGVGIDPDGYNGAVFDGQYVYFTPSYNGSSYHGEVLRYDTNDVFTDPCSWSTYDPGANGVGTDPAGYIGAVFDGRHVYFVPHHKSSGYHGEVLRFDTGLCRPGESDVDGDGVVDRCDICPADPEDNCDPNGSAAEEIDADQGGTIETPDGDLIIDIDPCDLTNDVTVSVTQTIPQDPNVDLMIGPSPGLGVAIAVYELEPDGLVFNEPVTITVAADVTHLNPNQRDRLTLYLHVDTDGDGVDDTFVPIEGSSCDVNEDPPGTFIEICTAELDHFSTIAMVASLDSDDDGIPDLFGDVEDQCPTLAVADSVLGYTGEMLVAVDQTGAALVTLAGVLTDDVGEPLPGVPVNFIVTGSNGNPAVDCSAITDVLGEAVCSLGLVPDIYAILVVSDALGCPVSSDETVLVVYDPSAGFTTGGGWFVPDSESFIDGVGVTDTVSKANFGFIVKYKKGADNPDGNLEFQYKAGDINLRSTNMEWLVVQSATKVRFKGKATINGEGSYTFKVTAEDNGEPGTGDWFKIEIWMGPDVDTENSPAVPKHKAQGFLGGGNVQIHQK